MEDISDLKSLQISKSISIDEPSLYQGKDYNRQISFSTANKVTAEVGRNFFHYLKYVNLPLESNLMLLPADRHYYYDEKDLESVKTLITLEKLNKVKHPYSFLQTLFCILPVNTNLVGYFSDIKTLSRYGFPNNPLSRLFKRFINFLDIKADRFLSKNEVARLLEENGFCVVNMTKMNGLTYFYSQKVSQTIQLSA
jgi:hypothetical protein